MSVEINKDMLYPSLLYNKPVKYDDYITLYPVTMNDVIMFNLLSQSITVRKNSTFRDKKIIKMTYLDFLIYASGNEELEEQYKIQGLSMFYVYAIQLLQLCCKDAEIEINPEGIKKLEDNLDRCVGNPRDFSEKDWENLHNPNEDIYEHIIAYVHFDAGTDNFNKLFIEVFTSYDDVELDVDKLVNEEEKQNIIESALESLHKWRGTDKIING